MQTTTRNAPVFAAWVSAICGVLGALILPFVLFLSIMEPSNEYGEPLHTITHDGPVVFFPGGLLLGIVALVLGIRLLTHQPQTRVTNALARIGLIAGSIAIFLMVMPTIGIVVTVFKR
ncbi:MAG: hypothetical protein H0X24_08940 [Ktedonobacterales bacterium]|nr:hypothetical protein [Ktedonobacterales bacterium]